jgi:hypothetical protein
MISTWVFYAPALLLVLSVPLIHVVMRGAIVLRQRLTTHRRPLRHEQAQQRYQQYRELKPYRKRLRLTELQRLLVGWGLVLAVLLTAGAFWIGNLPTTNTIDPTSGDVFDVTPSALTPETAHAVFVTMVVVGGALAIAALWTIMFGRMVNHYRADWYKAGLTTAERAEQKTARKRPRKVTGAS